MRGGRFLWFLISLGLGIVLGLAAGWVIAPLRGQSGGLETLEAASRAEYVLMVAEVYEADGDAAAAADRLAAFAPLPALRAVQEAIITGGERGYAKAELDRLARLGQGLQSLAQDNEATP